MKEYYTVRAAAEIEFTEKRSRFIGRCFPAATEEEALATLAALRRQHYDATHNCYAYAVGELGDIARFSDDGEPGGTAGLPMMEVLKKRGVTFALVVVTRYFGGILLGAGGLVRAYSRAASEAVAAAGVVCRKYTPLFSLTVPYPLWGMVESMLRSKAYPYSADYAECVRAVVCVPPEEESAFPAACVELTNAAITPVLCGREFREWDV